MPQSALRPCNTHGCPNLVARGYCDLHKDRGERKRPAGSATFYGSTYWKRLRASVRRAQPVCPECQQQKRVRPTETVHHIDGNWQNNEITNLQALCRECHDGVSGREHRAKATL